MITKFPFPFFKPCSLCILHALVLCLHVCLSEGARSPGTGVTDSCERPCGAGIEPRFSEEQLVLLSAEPYFQP